MESLNKDLIFKRQFILGKEKVNFHKEFWETKKISEYFYLTIHNELDYVFIGDDNKSLTLIGYILNPFEPDQSDSEIIKYLYDNTNNFDDLINLSTHLSGRWILIYNLNGEIKIFNDASSSRTLYYYDDISNPWIGSQPTILNYVVNDKLKINDNLNKYIKSDYYKYNENAWFGNKTIFENIYHLLPNHYLNMNQMKCHRFWVNLERKLTLEDIIEESSFILQSSIKAINLRKDCMLAVTAGIDSRILLAASKEVSQNIYYFVDAPNNNLSHSDVIIPSKLAEKNNFKFNIHKNIIQNSEEFDTIMRNNIIPKRELFKSKTVEFYFKNFKNKILISGNASGIAKSVYGKTKRVTQEKNIKAIMDATGIPTSLKYVELELEEWVSDINIEKMNNINILDLFYWEQRMGNWGSFYVSELDMAMESFMPFNNRLLLITMLSIEEEYRLDSSYLLYEELLRNMWGELLEVPINPLSNLGRIKKIVKSFMPNKIISLVQSINRKL